MFNRNLGYVSTTASSCGTCKFSEALLNKLVSSSQSVFVNDSMPCKESVSGSAKKNIQHSLKDVILE